MTLLHHLSRHQVASIAATCIDFAVMIACVRWLQWSPVLGTVLGASCGAVTNFTMQREWTFRAQHGHAGHQALRYAVVSAASLGLNALGEWGFAIVLGVPYVAARVVVAVLVGLCWNFPLHRYFVFPRERSA